MAANHDPFELVEPPAADPLLPGFGLWVWVAAAAFAIALAVFAAVLLARRKAAQAVGETLRDAAYREAASALGEIVAADARQAAVRCSLALRRYLVSAASDPALFETQEEFVSRHDALRDLPPAAREAVGRCFDLLAKAKYSPDPPDMPAEEIVGESRALLETLHRGAAA